MSAARRKRRKTDEDARRPAGVGEPPLPPAPARVLWIAALACFLTAFAVYLATLSPTVVGGDSGELIAAAHVLGIVHPPGYPLYTLLARLFSLLPVGSEVAFRVNLLSAVCDALAAALLCWGVGAWTRRPWAGVFSAALFAFSPVVWRYAVSAEVFPLNNLFAAGLVALTVAASVGPRPVLVLACGWLGLGLSNHHTLVFLGMPVVAYLAYRERSSLAPRRLVLAGLAFAAGFLPYAYLPLAGAAHPPASWGDPTTLSGFTAHLLRREYGTFRLASAEVGTGGSALPRIAQFVTRFGATTAWIGPLLALASAVAPREGERPGRRLALFWLATLAFYLVVFSALANVRLDNPLHRTVEERFWQQAIVVAAALAGVGFAGAVGRLGRRADAALLPAGAIACAAALALVSFTSMDERRNLLFRDYGRALLGGLPHDAFLLVTSDEAVGSVRFARWVERRRPDVRVATTGQVTSPWFRAYARRWLPGVVLPPGDFTALELMRANVGRRPVFVVNKVPWLQTLEAGYHPWTVGLAEEVLPKGTTPDLGSWVPTANAAFEQFDPGPADAFPEGSWERNLVDAYWAEYRRFGRSVVAAAVARQGDPEAHRLVVAALQPLADRDANPEPTLLKNLGAAYQHLRGSDPEAGARMARYWSAYLALEPGDPDAGAMRRLIEGASEDGVD